MPWYLYLALKQLFPTGKRFPFFTFLSLLGVTLGVALLVIALSVMGGFGHEIRRMLVDTSGQIQIRAQGLIRNPDELARKVAAVPEVAAVTPFAEGVVMLMADNKPAFPGIAGIDVGTVERVLPVGRYLRAGRLDDLDDDSVILSTQLARSLDAGLGSKIELYTPLMLERLKRDEVLLPRELRVVGLYEVGHNQIDSSTVICTLRLMQDLYGLGSSVHGLRVKLKDGFDEDRVAAKLNRLLPGDVRALSWIEMSQDFLFVLQLEKNLIFFLLLFIIVVAAFSVTSSLLISVVRKTREIGVLAALGAKPRQLAACFCLQGFLIGLFGTAGGVALGFAFLHYRNAVVRLLTELTQSQEALLRFYQFSQLPSYTAPHDLALIVVSAIVISTLAGLFPAWRAARLKPVEALRSE